jgi:hypothetical protein
MRGGEGPSVVADANNVQDIKASYSGLHFEDIPKNAVSITEVSRVDSIPLGRPRRGLQKANDPSHPCGI